jgi:glycosyltransferase involved in cell wall biosynthesis
MKHSTCSVVIPTFNRPQYLEMLLSSLRNQCPVSVSLEIIVVDDGSTPANRKKCDMLRRRFSVRLEVLPRNRGMAVARNRGITLSRGEWILFLDDDVTVNPGWYRELSTRLPELDENIIGFEGAVFPSGNGVWDREVSNLSGGAYLTSHLGIRRSVLAKCGMFDEAFSSLGPYSEDHEFAARLLQWGDVPFLRDIAVTHGARTVSLPRYLLSAPRRCRQLLSCERYFYNKHPDRYHFFRSRRTFSGSLSSVLFRNVVNDLRRRTLSGLAAHPLQTGVLIAGSLIEQCSAWCIAVRLLYIPKAKTFSNFSRSIDLTKTGHLWSRTSFTLDQLRLKRLFCNSLTFRFLRKPVYNAVPLLNTFSKKTISRQPKPYLRIDDFFLCNKDAVIGCSLLLKKRCIPFLAAIPMNDLINPDNAPLITRIQECGGVIALHGFTHRGSFGPYQSELLQMSFPSIFKQYRQLKKCRHIGKSIPKILVPPFNAIGPGQIVTLSHTFAVICGGPETVRFTGQLFGPVVLTSGALYFPSLHPFYGSSRLFLRNQIASFLQEAHGPICLTTHLADEAADGFTGLSHFLDRLPVSMQPWNRLY